MPLVTAQCNTQQQWASQLENMHPDEAATPLTKYIIGVSANITAETNALNCIGTSMHVQCSTSFLWETGEVRCGEGGEGGGGGLSKVS